MKRVEADDVGSDWEKEDVGLSSEEETHAITKAVPKVAVKLKVAAKPNVAAKPKIQEYIVPANLAMPLDDPSAERLRIKRIQEHRDMAMSGDIFGVSGDADDDFGMMPNASVLNKVGKPSPAAVQEKLIFTRFADIEKLLEKIHEAVDESKLKSSTWLRLLDGLLNICSPKMVPADMQTFARKTAQNAEQKIVNKNFANVKSKKNTDLKVNLNDPRSELAIYDGVGNEDSFDKYSEEYDDDDDDREPF